LFRHIAATPEGMPIAIYMVETWWFESRTRSFRGPPSGIWLVPGVFLICAGTAAVLDAPFARVWKFNV